jgi:hypothetical protein
MTESNNDAALIQTLVTRLEKHRLPVALELKEKVDRGEVLNDLEIAFLEEVFSDIGQIKPLLDRHPEWHALAGRMSSLYSAITAKALENEGK